MDVPAPGLAEVNTAAAEVLTVPAPGSAAGLVHMGGGSQHPLQLTGNEGTLRHRGKPAAVVAIANGRRGRAAQWLIVVCHI